MARKLRCGRPFLIEAWYSSPDQFRFRARRQKQTMKHLRFVLPVLLSGPIYQPHTERPKKRWVVAAPEPTPQLAERGLVQGPSRICRSR